MIEDEKNKKYIIPEPPKQQHYRPKIKEDSHQ